MSNEVEGLGVRDAIWEIKSPVAPFEYSHPEDLWEDKALNQFANDLERLMQSSTNQIKQMIADSLGSLVSLTDLIEDGMIIVGENGNMDRVPFTEEQIEKVIKDHADAYKRATGNDLTLEDIKESISEIREKLEQQQEYLKDNQEKIIKIYGQEAYEEMVKKAENNSEHLEKIIDKLSPIFDIDITSHPGGSLIFAANDGFNSMKMVQNPDGSISVNISLDHLLPEQREAWKEARSVPSSSPRHLALGEDGEGISLHLQFDDMTPAQILEELLKQNVISSEEYIFAKAQAELDNMQPEPMASNDRVSNVTVSFAPT